MLAGLWREGDIGGTLGDYVTEALKLARRAAALGIFATNLVVPHAAATAGDADATAFAPAIITETAPGAPNRDAQVGAFDADAPVRPHWCNKTSTLIADIHKLGGYSVMRADIGEGRVLERYWNASEEVVIEHGTDGTSCLVDLRRR